MMAVFVLAVLGGYWWVFGRAPEGREDERGFHRGGRDAHG